jgi:acetyl-CoA synthetase
MGRWAYGLDPGDVWWATSDIGWIVGHSYMVYGPLMAGCTTVVHEGAPDHPDADALWRVVEEERVTGLFVSPTAVRLLRGHGDEPPARHDLSSLRRVFCAGEPLEAEVWAWLQHDALGDRVPVLDNWWQTETGGPVIGYPYGLGPVEIRPGSAGVALPGAELAVVDDDGAELPPGEEGLLVLRRPMPALSPGIWGEPDRYAHDYLDPVPGAWFTGDAARIDEDGYVRVPGRADEIITSAAHRIGAVEVEAALESHPAVREAGVTMGPDELRGETVVAFAVLREGPAPGDALREELVAAVRGELGPLVAVGEIRFVAALPRAGDGALMRRVLRAVVLDLDPGDLTVAERAGTPEEARAAWAAMRAA